MKEQPSRDTTMWFHHNISVNSVPIELKIECETVLYRQNLWY